MAFTKRSNEFFFTLSLVLINTSLIDSTNINCNGKSFHCVNSTHFMICVDLGGGISTTVDDFVIPCPGMAMCKPTNRFECEFPPSTTPAPITQPNKVTNETKIATTDAWEEIVVTTKFPISLSKDAEYNDLSNFTIDSPSTTPTPIISDTKSPLDSTNSYADVVSNDSILNTTETYLVTTKDPIVSSDTFEVEPTTDAIETFTETFTATNTIEILYIDGDNLKTSSEPFQTSTVDLAQDSTTQTSYNVYTTTESAQVMFNTDNFNINESDVTERSVSALKSTSFKKGESDSFNVSGQNKSSEFVTMNTKNILSDVNINSTSAPDFINTPNFDITQNNYKNQSSERSFDLTQTSTDDIIIDNVIKATVDITTPLLNTKDDKYRNFTPSYINTATETGILKTTESVDEPLTETTISNESNDFLNSNWNSNINKSSGLQETKARDTTMVLTNKGTFSDTGTNISTAQTVTDTSLKNSEVTESYATFESTSIDYDLHWNQTIKISPAVIEKRDNSQLPNIGLDLNSTSSFDNIFHVLSIGEKTLLSSSNTNTVTADSPDTSMFNNNVVNYANVHGNNLRNASSTETVNSITLLDVTTPYSIADDIKINYSKDYTTETIRNPDFNKKNMNTFYDMSVFDGQKAMDDLNVTSESNQFSTVDIVSEIIKSTTLSGMIQSSSLPDKILPTDYENSAITSVNTIWSTDKIQPLPEFNTNTPNVVHQDTTEQITTSSLENQPIGETDKYTIRYNVPVGQTKDILNNVAIYAKHYTIEPIVDTLTITPLAEINNIPSVTPSVTTHTEKIDINKEKIIEKLINTKDSDTENIRQANNNLTTIINTRQVNGENIKGSAIILPAETVNFTKDGSTLHPKEFANNSGPQTRKTFPITSEITLNPNYGNTNYANTQQLSANTNNYSVLEALAEVITKSKVNSEIVPNTNNFNVETTIGNNVMSSDLNYDLNKPNKFLINDTSYKNETSGIGNYYQDNLTGEITTADIIMIQTTHNNGNNPIWKSVTKANMNSVPTVYQKETNTSDSFDSSLIFNSTNNANIIESDKNVTKTIVNEQLKQQYYPIYTGIEEKEHTSYGTVEPTRISTLSEKNGAAQSILETHLEPKYTKITKDNLSTSAVTILANDDENTSETAGITESSLTASKPMLASEVKINNKIYVLETETLSSLTGKNERRVSASDMDVISDIVERNKTTSKLSLGNSVGTETKLESNRNIIPRTDPIPVNLLCLQSGLTKCLSDVTKPINTDSVTFEIKNTHDVDEFKHTSEFIDSETTDSLSVIPRFPVTKTSTPLWTSVTKDNVNSVPIVTHTEEIKQLYATDNTPSSVSASTIIETSTIQTNATVPQQSTLHIPAISSTATTTIGLVSATTKYLNKNDLEHIEAIRKLSKGSDNLVSQLNVPKPITEKATPTQRKPLKRNQTITLVTITVENTNKDDEVINTTSDVTQNRTEKVHKTTSAIIKPSMQKVNTGRTQEHKVVMTPVFTCSNRLRGRYADEHDCRKFYICIGRIEPIIGHCPNETVYSEIRTRCTRNLSHCIRNNQFTCSSQGRFPDYYRENTYYICVLVKKDSYIRFKFQCQTGYHLNKNVVKCEEDVETRSRSNQSVSKDSRNDSLRENKSIDYSRSKNKDFQCEKEGKFVDPDNCRKYYVCSIKKSEFRKRKKKCDSDEVFHKEKKKCVDEDSYEC